MNQHLPVRVRSARPRRRRTATALAAGSLVLGAAGVAAAALPSQAAGDSTSFSMGRSGVAQTAGCLRNATARVTVTSQGAVETMVVDARKLPANTDFDLFVIQVPDAPFGVSWYQGDLETDSHGAAHGEFVGRFSIETFAVAPNVAPAPHTHDSDASTNPAFAPVHTYHLGLWFNDPADAVAAGCPGTVTPFNGDHTAGVQALSTRKFPIAAGPLAAIGS